MATIGYEPPWNTATMIISSAAAFTGTVYLHGRVKPGGVTIVRAPTGEALLPVGLARGALLAEATLLPAGPPNAPRQVAYGYAW